jgi:hypothetical protein
MLADLVVITGLAAALAATVGWMALMAAGLSRADESRFPPQWAWVLLCVFSPLGAVSYLIASQAWGAGPGFARFRRDG